MKITQLQPRDLITCSGSDSIRIAAKLLTQEDIGAVAVFSGSGVRGIFSERDLAHAVADGVELDDTPVNDYMTKGAVTVEQSGYVGDAVAKMNEFGLRHLVVIDGNDVIGMISMRDIVSLLGAKWTEP